MKAFITGSRAYGKPTEESDLDLVILCTVGTELQLRRFADQLDDSRAIRFGKLNIITCTDDKQYSLWKYCTEYLLAAMKEGEKITKGFACKTFEKFMHGIDEEYRGESH